MRSLGLAVLVLAAALPAEANTRASDPAFLGINMLSAGTGCQITGVTDGGPAQEAGLRAHDIVYTIDKGSIAGPDPCQTLADRIVAHRPGSRVELDVRRGAQRVTITATLSTRGEVMHRRLHGEPMLATDLLDLDDDKVSYDLSARGRTTVVGWFNIERCTGCARVFDRVAEGLRKRLADQSVPSLLAVTAPTVRADLMVMRKSFNSSVSLALADEELFDELALNDSQRISFMVIDCRGVVRHVAPIAPDAEDFAAAIDDVLAAAEQAEHLRTRR